MRPGAQRPRERRPHRHLFRVDGEPEAFLELAAAAEAAGLRSGWLDWDPDQGSGPSDGGIAAPFSRRVGVTADATRSFKRRRGPAVLADVLREHFGGHAVVLARGLPAELSAPTLRAAGGSRGGWRLGPDGGGSPILSTAELIRRLGRPPHDEAAR